MRPGEQTLADGPGLMLPSGNPGGSPVPRGSLKAAQRPREGSRPCTSASAVPWAGPVLGSLTLTHQ